MNVCVCFILHIASVGPVDGLADMVSEMNNEYT